MKKNNKLPKTKVSKPLQKSKPPQKFDSFFKFGKQLFKLGKQLLVALVGLFLLNQVEKSSDGYRWMYEDLLKKNMVTIKKYPEYSLEQRYQMKMGFSMAYIDYVKQNTPDTAVILFPDHQIISDTKDPKQNFSGMVGWCSTKYGYYRFLYPRKVVFESEKEQSPFFEKITHVAIINGWGYEYLSYPVPVEYQSINAISPIHPKQ